MLSLGSDNKSVWIIYCLFITFYFLSLLESSTPSSGLSAGAIAGIVIACLVVVVAAGVGVYYCVRKK